MFQKCCTCCSWVLGFRMFQATNQGSVVISQQTIHIHLDKWINVEHPSDVFQIQTPLTRCQLIVLGWIWRPQSQKRAQKPEETCWVIVCWLMCCAAACQFLYFRNSRQRLIKIGELGKDWGQPGARLTKMNYIELRYYTTEWCCINTAGCFGLQFDPCSLIPRNRLFSAVALCSRFVCWIICQLHMFTVIHNVFCFSTALLVATSTKPKLSTKRQLPSVCSMQSFFSLQR